MTFFLFDYNRPPANSWVLCHQLFEYFCQHVSCRSGLFGEAMLHSFLRHLHSRQAPPSIGNATLTKGLDDFWSRLNEGLALYETIVVLLCSCHQQMDIPEF